ncbi:ABC transporter ATP-binding protein [Clostridium sp. 'deep sea']|uniref:ABC transporter ATP-binding protein n=1 Tax=Clostridium sp. 'deep sea' TaxID=2779445 RepID=UPI0018963F66|nr:ABC transporter ATP-binding protein [Clostridium sp. 'deep sea']QOR34909.1 ABC transporter ATP-binding protein [Clostridium sp. 'deep sea']
MKDNNKHLKSKYGKTTKASILLTMSVVMGIMPIFLIMKTISLYSVNELTINHILLYGSLVIVCQLCKAMFYGFSIKKAHQLAYNSLIAIRTDIINHLKKLPISFFRKRKTGDLTKIINHDVEQVEVYLAHGYPEIMVATLIPLVIFLSLIYIDWRIALSLVSTIPIMLFLLAAFNKLWSNQFAQYHQTTKEMSEDLLEYIATMPVIKAFGDNETRTNKVLKTMNKYIKWVKKVASGMAVPMSFIGMFVTGGLVMVAIAGSLLLENGLISTNEFVISIILSGIFVSSFAKLSSFQHQNIVYNNTLNSINSILGEDIPECKQTSDVVNSNQIVINKVTFSYDDKRDAIKDLNVSFKPNTVNAIVGLSGSGKTTIANLVMGFYKTNKGEISIGNKNIANMSEVELNELVSIVQQEVFLFNLSIENNIKIGKKDATRQEIIEAAKKAQIHDTIMSFKNGYDTIVGESGAKLSGGEKQRISIARIILKNSPIIILDEATSAIDPHNEHLIQQSIEALVGDKTIIMIAHHLNTIVKADQIIVMHEGEAIATGTHQELLKSCSLYSELINQEEQAHMWQIRECV